jgi:hypothetical protein
MRKLVRTATACMVLMAGAPALADVVSFTGTVTGLSYLIGPAPPSCAPLPYQTAIDPASTIGHSNLGDFTLSTQTCIALGGGTSFGTFIINFGTDQFSGSFNGGSTPTSIPTISNTDWLFTILNGTGRFADASGMFEGIGTADATTRPTHVAIDFTAVPEPTTWALMLVGFGGIGFALRRRPQPAIKQIA